MNVRPMKSALKSTAVIQDLFQKYHDPKYLVWDPLSVTRRYQGTKQEEWVALLSALFAFGGVKQIIASVENVLSRLQLREQDLFTPMDRKQEIALANWVRLQCGDFRHRIYTGDDVTALWLRVRASILKYGSLKNHFLQYHQADADTIEAGLVGMIHDFRRMQTEDDRVGPHFSHLLNSPSSNSACKRWVMFLKWMVRPDDGIDLGTWSGDPRLRPEQLIIPLDTHLFRISRQLRLTNKKTANWKTALEVTKKLKKIDPADPTRFDFSLCRYGMLRFRKLN